MNRLLIVTLCLGIALPAFAQDATPPASVTLEAVAPPDVVVIVPEATQEADAPVSVDVTVNMPAAEPTPPPALENSEREQLLTTLVGILSFVVIAALVVIGALLRQYPEFVKTAQNSTPPWLDELIRSTIRSAIIAPTRTHAEGTPDPADDERIARIEQQLETLMNTLLGAPAVPALTASDVRSIAQGEIEIAANELTRTVG